MKRILKVIFMLSSVAGGFAYSDDYVFRGPDRPAYDDTVSVDQLKEMRDSKKLILLDVRLIEDYESDPILIPGASYRNPEDIETWSNALPDDARVVVYCVKGKWVSQKAASYLNYKDIDVQSLEGGIEAWKADGTE